MSMETVSQARCFGGVLGVYSHASQSTQTPMKFAVYAPPQAASGPCPVLFYLAGLECTQDTFVQKAGALRVAAALGLMLVAPDTSPRGAGVPGEDDSWDFGTSASFYLDAVQPAWAKNYRMATYVNTELPALLAAHFPADLKRAGIMGHSMGGHGALVSAFHHPAQWRSVSALAPICNPAAVPWGEKAFSGYLGDNRDDWARWDASLLMRAGKYPGEILVDQGLADRFLQTQLRPETLEDAARASGQQLLLRRHEGYDHSYWFIQTVIEDHLRHHARSLS